MTLNIAHKNPDTMLGNAVFELLKDMIDIMSYCDGMLVEFLHLIVGNNILVKDFYATDTQDASNEKITKLMRDILRKIEKTHSTYKIKY